MWYGWIPVLSEKEPGVIRGHPLRSTPRFRLYAYRDDPNSLYAEIDLKNGIHEISISIDNGFFVFNGLEDVVERQAALIIDSLYGLLKESYHVDITHSPGNGLPPVMADNPNEAIVLTADAVTQRCERFLFEVDGMVDVETLRSVYLESRGFVEYGISFVNHYETELEDLYFDYYERLMSLSRFMETIYETKRDAIQDDLTYQSKVLSESMMKLSKNTETLSVTVIAITVFSVIMTCFSFFYDHPELTFEQIIVVNCICLVGLVIVISLYYLLRRKQ